jgi:acetyltransferase-like isoleucine patch superfamily enzyme
VVVGDVPPHTTVVGIPARVVRRREPAAGGRGPAAEAGDRAQSGEKTC